MSIFETFIALNIRAGALAAAIFTVKLLVEKDFSHALVTGIAAVFGVLMAIAHRRKVRQQAD